MGKKKDETRASRASQDPPETETPEEYEARMAELKAWLKTPEALEEFKKLGEDGHKPEPWDWRLDYIVVGPGDDNYGRDRFEPMSLDDLLKKFGSAA